MQTLEVEQRRFELNDLIIQYPPPSQPGFQALISQKEEFAALNSTRDEPLPTKIGDYFKHQKFTHTFLRNNDNLLIIDETGTGKSASVLGYTEYCIDERLKMQRQEFDYDEINAQYKKIYFIGENLQQVEFTNQLAKKINPSRYGPSDEVMNKTYNNEIQKDRAIRANVKKNIKEFYEIKTYAGLISEIKTKKESLKADNIRRALGLSDEELYASLYEEYSNCIFWLDEAHYFVSSVTVGKNKNEKKKDDEEKAANKAEGYLLVHDLFHKIKNSKVILTTATPLINKQSDIIKIMNLILPKNGEYPLYFNPDDMTDIDQQTFFGRRKISPENFQGQMPDNFNFNQGIEAIEPYFRARITYVRAGDIGANIEYMGHTILPSDEDEKIKDLRNPSTIVYVSEMSEHQENGYMRSVNSKGVYLDEKQAALFVFPNGKYGEDGAKLYFESYIHTVKDDNQKTRESEKYYRYLTTPEARAFKKQLTQLEARTSEDEPLGIADMSCKYASIIREIKTMKKGCAFVLSELVEGSGLGVLSLCFEGQGFERYKEYNPVFIEKDGVRTIRETFVKKPRYAIFDGSMTSTPGGKRIIRKILDIMNSEENMNGEYIKVLLVSGVGGVGINISSGLQVHLASGDWNESLMYQAISRVARADSIRFLKKHYPNIKFTIRVYKHAATLVDNPDKLSIDIRRYLRSEQKDRQNKIIYRWMKQCAIGAIVHRERNILPTDEDESQECDYQSCDYLAFDQIYHQELIEEQSKDYSTYDILYAKNNMEQLIPLIRELYSINNNYTLDQIDYYLRTKINLRRSSIIYALEYLINNKIPIKNQFGYNAFLLEDMGNFYLDINFPTGHANYLMNYYSQSIILHKPETLEEVKNFLYKDMIHAKTEKIMGTNNDSGKKVITTINFDKLSFEEKISLLEKTFTTKVQPQLKSKVTTYFKNYLFIFPPFQIEEVEKDKKKRGRREKKVDIKEKGLSAVTISEIAEEDMPIYKSYKDLSNEGILVHTFSSTKAVGTSYGKTTAKFKGEVIRILDTEDDISQDLSTDGDKNYYWRDPNSVEELIYYNRLIQETNLANIIIPYRKKALEAGGIYGIHTEENAEKVLKVADIINEKEGAEKNNAKRAEGLKCVSYTKPEIIEFLWNNGYDDTQDDDFPSLPNVDHVADDVIEEFFDANMKKFTKSKHIDNDNWTDDKKRYFYKFLHASGAKYQTTTAGLCARLDKLLSENDLVFEL